MLIDLDKKIEYLGGSHKHFSKGEYHVKRRSRTDILILMLGGTLYFSEDGQEIAVPKGEYYVQRVGLYQSSSRPSDDAHYIYLDFMGSWCDEGIYGLPVRGSFNVEKIYPLADCLCQTFKSRNQSLTNTSRIFLGILDGLFEDNPRHDDRLRVAAKIHEYLSENFSHPIDVSTVAAEFSYTPDYLIRVFKRAYGVTPHSYLTDRRIEYAKLLLSNTDRPVGEVAEACGYTDFTTFFRSFRNRTGVSPTAYRHLA